MADLCQTCGIRLDPDGLCQCPEVLLERVELLDGKLYEAQAALRGLLGLWIAYTCPYCGEEIYRLPFHQIQSTSNNETCRAHDAQCSAMHKALGLDRLRSLRAKLMRERADTHEANSKVAFLAAHDMRREHCSAQADVYEAENESLIERARRLRAKADRIERGAP